MDAPVPEEQSETKGRPALRKLTLVLAALAMVLLVLEGAFRLLGIRAAYHAPPVSDLTDPGDATAVPRPDGRVPFAVIRSTYDSDPRGYFGSANMVEHVLNSLGFRDVEHTIAKPPNTLRILGLGDSYLFGQGVKSEDVVLTKVRKLLDGAVPGATIETINTGVSGVDTAYQRDVLLQHGLQYDPDLAILHFCLNDVEEDPDRGGPKIELFTDYTSLYQVPDGLSTVSRVWGWLRQRYLIRYRVRPYLRECTASFRDDPAKWARCRDALADIHRICGEHSIPLLIVVFPLFCDLDGDYPFQLVHDTLRAYCRSVGIRVLDLRHSYKGFEGPELWAHPSDPHPNEIAHDIAARVIADHLRRNLDAFGLRAPDRQQSGDARP